MSHAKKSDEVLHRKYRVETTREKEEELLQPQMDGFSPLSTALIGDNYAGREPFLRQRSASVQF